MQSVTTRKKCKKGKKNQRSIFLQEYENKNILHTWRWPYRSKQCSIKQWQLNVGQWQLTPTIKLHAEGNITSKPIEVCGKFGLSGKPCLV
jgi:hypothetical protein